MVKYIDSVIARLRSLKTGMENNPALWNGLNETPANVQVKIDELLAKEKQMNDAQTEWKVRISESHTLSDIAEKYADKLEALATGIHNETPKTDMAKEKACPKPRSSTSTMINYQWFKGSGKDPKDANTVPDLLPFKITTKTTFVDDDVEKGIRYFYRVQAFNSNGSGPVSEAVSRIQQ
ncbi:MAG: fibronectin type III domain-containing protein [Ignavibacteria bacterium]|nr:fibronectin type III domain-containing protein [Ignavibacteria bacterium]